MMIWDHSRRCKIVNKTISILLIQAFLLSNIAFALPTKSNIDSAKKQDIAITPDSVVVPRDFGLVKNKFTGNSGKFIVHIQDAHCNYEAQSNIVKIVEGLIKNYNLGLVSVEGADGFIDTSWFKAFPDDEVRKEVADYFMKKGEITGPEFLSITTDLPFKLFGAETRSYYIQNLNAFTASYPLKGETEKYFNSIKTVLSRLKGYIYSEELKALDAKVQDYESKKIQFNDYIRFLQALAEHHQINLRSYDNFFRLVSVLIYEKKIDFNLTDKERSALIDELSKAITKDQLQQLVSLSISFKSGRISSAEYYAYLKNLAASNSIDLSKKYPNLYNYIIYNAVYSKIENEKLFQDLKNIEIAVKEKLFTNDDQRTLEKLSRHIDILLGLINIKLMNGDFDYYQANKAEFTSEYFIDFIKKKTTQYGFAYEITPPTEAVAKSIPQLEDFYSIAIKRDKALVDNTLNAMKKEKQNIAVLVTGGFHSEGIAKLLEKEGVSYMVVCPSITKDVPTPYIEILTNQRTPLENILVGTAHAKEGSVAAQLMTQWIALSPKGLEKLKSEFIPGPDGRTPVDRHLDFRNGWAAIEIDGVKTAAININGIVAHMLKEVGGLKTQNEIEASIIDEINNRCARYRVNSDVRKALVEMVKAEFPSIRERFEKEFTARAAEVAERRNLKARRDGAVQSDESSPGTKAIDGDNLAAKELTYKEARMMDEILRQSFADKTYKIVTAKELGFTELGDFQFVVHYGLEARIEKYNKEHGTNLPTDRVHPGRGGEVFQHGLRQGHISAFRFENLTNAGLKEALRIIGTHELAHIQIANKENSEAYRAALRSPGVDEELIVDRRVPGADTRKAYGWLRGNMTIRQFLANIDEERKRNAVYQIEETVLTDSNYGTAARDEIVRLRNEGKSYEAGEFAKTVYERRNNIDRIKKVLTEPYNGYDVIIISSTTEGEAKDQQAKLEKVFKGVKTSNKDMGNKVCVLSVLDSSEGNNLIGQDNTWVEACKAFKKWARDNNLPETDLAKLQSQKRSKIVTYHNGGKAERFSPAGQALNLSRADQLLVGNIFNKQGEPVELNLLLAVILSTSYNAASNDGTRHDVYWANQIEFGTAPSTERHDYVFNKFAVALPANPDMKDLFDYGTLIATKDGRILKFIGNKRLTMKGPDGKYIPNPDWQAQYNELMEAAREGRAYFDYGSFSMSLDMQNALLEYWRDVKNIFHVMGGDKEGRAGISREIDPHMTQIMVPLVNGIIGKEAMLGKLPSIADLNSVFGSYKNAVLDKAYNALINIMSPEYKAVLEDLHNKAKKELDAGKPDNMNAIYETIEFFIRYKHKVNLSKGFGIIDFGPSSHWFAYKRLLDMGNEKFFMLADLAGTNIALEPNGDATKTQPNVWDKVRAEDARRLRSIKDDAVCVFEVSGHRVTLNAEQVRNGWEGYGVRVRGSIIQGNTVLLPGSVILSSVINNSQGLIQAQNSYVESSTSSMISAYNSIIINALDEKEIPAKKEIVADAYRPVIRDARFQDGHTRMRGPVGYDPKPADKALAAKMSDGVKFGDNAYSFGDIRNLPCGKAANERIFDLARRLAMLKVCSALNRAEYCKTKFKPVKMGTSGLRGNANINDPVNFVLTDLEVYINLRAELRYLCAAKDIQNLNNDYVLSQVIAGALPANDGVFALGGDRRESTVRLCRAIALAALAEGVKVDFQGLTASPVIANYGLNSNNPMTNSEVTASHNPKNENGVKTDRLNGELLKLEEPLLAKYITAVRQEEYAKSWEDSMFDFNGALRGINELADPASADLLRRAGELVLEDPNGSLALSNVKNTKIVSVPKTGTMPSDLKLSPADALYLNRYVEAFGQPLKGKTIICWQQSAVGRDIIPLVFEALGATVIRKDSAEEFASVDTENLSDEVKDRMRRYSKEYEKEIGTKPFAIITFDGDSDRPVFCDENGEFLYGDKLGVLTNIFLGVEFTDLPVTANTNALKLMSKKYGIQVVNTRVGSPYVIEAAMRQEEREIAAGGKLTRKAGFECNGGYILMSDLTMSNGKVLKSLPTRDAFLPMLSAMLLAMQKNMSVSQLIASEFSGEYESYAAAGLVENVPGGKCTPGCEVYKAEMGPAIVASFTPKSPDAARITNIIFEDGKVYYTTEDSEERREAPAELADSAKKITQRLQNYINMLPGLKGVGINRINYLDGVRIYLNNIDGEIVHLRPSGNAAQFRMYAEASTQARANELKDAAKMSGTGVLVHLIQDFAAGTSTTASNAQQKTVQQETTPGIYAVSAFDRQRSNQIKSLVAELKIQLGVSDTALKVLRDELNVIPQDKLEYFITLVQESPAGFLKQILPVVQESQDPVRIAELEMAIEEFSRLSPPQEINAPEIAPLAQKDMDRIMTSILGNYATGDEVVSEMFKYIEEPRYLDALAVVSNELNKRYAAMTQEERNAAWPVFERVYAAMSERALTIKDINVAKGLQIMVGNTIALQNLIDNGIKGAEKITLTTNLAEMLKAPDAVRGPSYINGLSIPGGMVVAIKEGAEGIYWRGAESVSKLGKNGENIIPEAVYAENKDKLDRLVMYTMLHVSGMHTTVFLHNRLPGSIQHISTGRGHFQSDKLDMKRMVRGQMVQFSDIYNTKGEMTANYAQNIGEGEAALSIPGSVDYISPISRIAVFNDVSARLAPAHVLNFNPGLKTNVAGKTIEQVINDNLAIIEHAITHEKPSQAGYTIVSYGKGSPALIKVNEKALDVIQLVPYNDLFEIFGVNSFRQLTDIVTSGSVMIDAFIAQLAIRPRTAKTAGQLKPVEPKDIKDYVKALETLDQIIHSGQPIVQRLFMRLGIDGYTWGNPIVTQKAGAQVLNPILEQLGKATLEEQIETVMNNLTAQQKAAYEKEYNKIPGEKSPFDEWLKEEIKVGEVLAELWEGAGDIDVGTGYLLPVEVLGAFWPNEVYGARHVQEVGIDSGITNKRLASAKTLSIQIHDFVEMIRPLQDGYAYVGLKKSLTRDEFAAAMKAHDRSIFHRVKVEKDKLYVIPAFTIHAYDADNFVSESKDVPASQDSKRTTSFGDWLKLSAEDMAKVAAIVAENIPVEAAKKLIESKLLRENKDLLTMVTKDAANNITGLDQAKIDKILDTLVANGSLNRIEPKDLEFPSILASEEATQNVARAEIMGMTEGFVGGRYTISAGHSVASGALIPPETYHVIFVEKGKVTVTPEKGEPFTAELGKQIPMLAKMGSYTIKAEEDSVVSTSYRPLSAESLVITGFEAIRANLPTVRSNKVHLITTEKAFRRGNEHTPGSWKHERDVLSAISNGMVDVKAIETSSIEKLKDNLKSLVGAEKGVTYVVQLTEDEFDSIKKDSEIDKLLKNTRLMVLPNVKFAENRGIPFIREIESAGVILGNTTEKDIRDKTAMAGWLKTVMSKLTGNKAIDWDMLNALVAAKSPDLISFEQRVDFLLKHLQVKLEPYKADEGVRERRQLLWSV
ncbi:MAG: hypothetical protein WC738_01260 [Candidatus Omnitrophota bacterium]|jgi:phosphomannomutase